MKKITEFTEILKNFTNGLTPEQKTVLGNCYVINDDNELVPIISIGEVTIENFKIVIENNDELSIAKVEDIRFYNPEIGDFDFVVGDTYFYREDSPDDVVKMLDEYLKRDSYNK